VLRGACLLRPRPGTFVSLSAFDDERDVHVRVTGYVAKLPVGKGSVVVQIYGDAKASRRRPVTRNPVIVYESSLTQRGTAQLGPSLHAQQPQLHGRYSLCVPPAQAEYSASDRSVYESVHKWFKKGFRVR
jgi:hypothetical protein